MSRRHIRSPGWITASILTSVLLISGCNRISEGLGLSSPPAKAAPIEKGDPAAAASAAQIETTKGAPAATGTRRGTTAGSRNRTPSARRTAAVSPVAPPVGSGTSADAATSDPDTLAASGLSNSAPSAAPVVTGSRPAYVDQRSIIYSQADTDVVPARLLTVQNGGPLFRNMKMDVNTIELVISKQGRVEQVRLVSPVKRMTDMLLLSGAKTWRFSPALKNGQPVRYRTQYSWQTTP
jgi:hypothetical protein